MESKFKGHVKWFDTTKGYGFILLSDESGDILLHSNVLRNFGRGSVAEGTEIEFEVQETDRGRQVSKILDILPPKNSVDKEVSDLFSPKLYFSIDSTIFLTLS